MRRRFPNFFNDLFNDDFFKDFERLAADLETRSFEAREQGKPLVYGVNMTIGPDGKPHIREFGNARRPNSPREPLVDVINGEKEIVVIVELPGVNKEQLKLHVENNELSVSVEDPSRPFARTIKLPAKVKKNESKAALKNGMLEVVLPKVKASKPKGKAIKVE
jgi:HSP20 family protein